MIEKNEEQLALDLAIPKEYRTTYLAEVSEEEAQMLPEYDGIHDVTEFQE